MRFINTIWMHCAATPAGRVVTTDEIRSWHVNGNGWSDIGYHAVAELNKTSCVPGRPESRIGAHVGGYNSGSLGICYVGGVAATSSAPQDTRTGEQQVAMLEQIRTWVDAYPSIKYIRGHNEVANKACPSFTVKTDPWVIDICKELGLNGYEDGGDPETDPPELGLVAKGDRGQDVVIWQQALHAYGYRDIEADGIFGTNTDRATRFFQAAWALRPDGIVGPLTREAQRTAETVLPT